MSIGTYGGKKLWNVKVSQIGYNATQSRLDGYLENSTTNGLARESNVTFFSNGYTLYGAPVKDAVCVPQWVDKTYN